VQHPGSLSNRLKRARPAQSCRGRKGWRGSCDRRSRGSAAHKTNRDGFTGKANCTSDQELTHRRAKTNGANPHISRRPVNAPWHKSIPSRAVAKPNRFFAFTWSRTISLACILTAFTFAVAIAILLH
jgi:hypothetical protein